MFNKLLLLCLCLLVAITSFAQSLFTTKKNTSSGNGTALSRPGLNTVVSPSDFKDQVDKINADKEAERQKALNDQLSAINQAQQAAVAAAAANANAGTPPPAIATTTPTTESAPPTPSAPTTTTTPTPPKDTYTGFGGSSGGNTGGSSSGSSGTSTQQKGSGGGWNIRY